ncbi:MinD/ParA family ATP-binding protein [Halomarina litorea]|uniref:MinD/ParA family ATP-binding protein n=1 Tax=Halomarina litorea TaxID=2961595 RepID=UPI0020C59FA6|nr:P-loop NTPase [Halomarina sp. BCD28]
MLAVVGGKGGVGKTTTTLGVARALGRAGRRAVAVDADRDAPNLARVADVDSGDGPGRSREHVESAASAVDALAAGASVGAVATPGPDHPEVLVVPGGPAPSSAYRDALCRVRAHDGPVVVDCPAGAGRDVALPLGLADRALVVSTSRPAALRDAAKTAAMADALDTPLVGAVLTRCRAVPDGVGALLGGVPVTAIPPVADPLGSRAVAATYRRVTHRFSRHKG